jgi:hypothetical protein
LFAFLGSDEIQKFITEAIPNSYHQVCLAI